MASPADRQAEAIADVERIAAGLFAALDDEFARREIGWEEVTADMQERWRAMVRTALRSDLVRVGHRPPVEQRLAGQINFEGEIE